MEDGKGGLSSEVPENGLSSEVPENGWPGWGSVLFWSAA